MRAGNAELRARHPSSPPLPLSPVSGRHPGTNPQRTHKAVLTLAFDNEPKMPFRSFQWPPGFREGPGAGTRASSCTKEQVDVASVSRFTPAWESNYGHSSKQWAPCSPPPEAPRLLPVALGVWGWVGGSALGSPLLAAQRFWYQADASSSTFLRVLALPFLLWDNTVWMDHSSVDGHLCCLTSAVLHRAAMNLCHLEFFVPIFSSFKRHRSFFKPVFLKSFD